MEEGWPYEPGSTDVSAEAWYMPDEESVQRAQMLHEAFGGDCK